MDTRETEGRNLKNDLLTKLDALDEKVSAVEARSPEVVQAYREKLEAKVHELLEDSQIDDNRIAAEVVIYSDTVSYTHLYLMVDEFQDINPVQYDLIREWNKKGKELFVIGDPDQSLYGFRGSDSGCFLKMKEEFPETCMISLEKMCIRDSHSRYRHVDKDKNRGTESS